MILLEAILVVGAPVGRWTTADLTGIVRECKWGFHPAALLAIPQRWTTLSA
jgi:hypothetical protein